MKNINIKEGYAEFDSLQYVSDKPLPKVDDELTVTFNGINKVIVTGYFVEYGFIGLLCRPIDPPQWYIKQNGRDASCHIFPSETKELRRS